MHSSGRFGFHEQQREAGDERNRAALRDLINIDQAGAVDVDLKRSCIGESWRPADLRSGLDDVRRRRDDLRVGASGRGAAGATTRTNAAPVGAAGIGVGRIAVDCANPKTSRR